MAQQKGEHLWYIVTDHLGTPRELLDENGQLAWSNSPNVWGQARLWQAANDEFARSNVAPINKTTCPLRFPGQYYDEESGLHYNRHRYYDPETAQYLSPDPLGLGGGVRPQGYVDNPLSWVDPLGLIGCLTNGDKTSQGLEFTKHGAERANERGFHPDIIDSIVSNNAKHKLKEIDEFGRATHRYQDNRGNTVILNEEKTKIITVYSHPQRSNNGHYVPKPPKTRGKG